MAQTAPGHRNRHGLGIFLTFMHQDVSILAHRIRIITLRIGNSASCGESGDEISRLRLAGLQRRPELPRTGFKLGKYPYDVGRLKISRSLVYVAVSQLSTKDTRVHEDIRIVEGRLGKTIGCLSHRRVFTFDRLDSRLPLVSRRHSASSPREPSPEPPLTEADPRFRARRLRTPYLGTCNAGATDCRRRRGSRCRHKRA